MMMYNTPGPETKSEKDSGDFYSANFGSEHDIPNNNEGESGGSDN